MKEVVLQIPTLEAEQNIEIEVKVNGKKRILKYRVEIVDLKTDETLRENQVTVLRRVIRDYDSHWELIQIGAPSRDHIPVMFRKKAG